VCGICEYGKHWAFTGEPSGSARHAGS